MIILGNYLKIDKYSIENGPGIRVSLFLSGCPMQPHCKGCHNPESWDFKAGKEFKPETLEEVLDACSSDYIAGLSILGGEQLACENLSVTLALAHGFKSKFPNKTLWIWSGYTLEVLVQRATESDILTEILSCADVAVTGPFEIDKRDITKANLWRGSRNQRVIDLKKTLAVGRQINLAGIPNND